MDIPGEYKRGPESPLKKVLCCLMPNSERLPPVYLHGSMDSGLDQLMTSLDDVSQRENCKDLDLNFLKSVFESSDFKSLLKLHETITTPESKESKAVTAHACKITNELIDSLDILCLGPECIELQEILQRPHVQALLSAHDQIAGKQFYPHLPDIAQGVDEDEQLCVKLLTIIKGHDEPLGATIQRNGECGTINVARVMHGGAADRSGLFEVGDEVKEVNGRTMNGHSPQELVNLLSDTNGPVVLKISPGSQQRNDLLRNTATVRATFDYNPGEDPFTPCPEASLAFSRGDVLDIVNKDDTWWWQARKEGGDSARAGLIPSRLLAGRLGTPNHTRESGKANRNITEDRKGSFSPRLNKRSKKCKATPTDYTMTSENCYIDVTSHDPGGTADRPLVLIAPLLSTAQTVKDRMLEKYPDVFSVPTFCSNKPQNNENTTCTSKFVSSQELEKLIRDKKMLEHEERDGYLTALVQDDLMAALSDYKTCLIACKPESIYNIRKCEVKPYMVFFKSPLIEKSKSSSMFSKKTKDTEAQRISELSHSILEQYGHLFDFITMDTDSDKTDQYLKDVCKRLRTNASWIPRDWSIS